jgi:ADA HAT complex component 1
MVIKRKSDNKQVKLVCLDCRRFDFSSTQGFINHCRIAHSRTFASHDAAAEACGEPVDVDEAGVIIGGTTPNEPPIIVNPGSVHPLIRTAHTIEKTTVPLCSETPSKVAKSKKGHRATPSSPFKASPATPHLSSMLAGLGSKLNLDQIVGDAKTLVDLTEFMSEGESEDEDASEEPQVGTGARLPSRTTMPQAASQRPTSSKRHEVSMSQDLDISTPTKVSHAPVQYPQTFLPSALPLEESGATDLIHMDDNLSPVTVVSHQAPSLVSDNEDDEFEAASDSDNFSSRSSDDGHDDDDDDDDIEVEDDEASTTSTKTTHEVTSFRRSQDKKRDRVLPPAIVSLNPGGKRQNPSKSKKAGNQKKGN